MGRVSVVWFSLDVALPLTQSYGQCFAIQMEAVSPLSRPSLRAMNMGHLGLIIAEEEQGENVWKYLLFQS